MSLWREHTPKRKPNDLFRDMSGDASEYGERERERLCLLSSLFVSVTPLLSRGTGPYSQ